jgi:hypothetical protein
MLASILIIGISAFLLVYWFRYSCILVLRVRAEQADLAAAAMDLRFSFAQVQELLKSAQHLAPLQKSLDRDYQLLTYLVRHAAGLELESLEDRLLVLDYKMMRCWYRLTKVAFPTQARQALSEMATIIGVLVRRVGEQAGVQA